MADEGEIDVMGDFDIKLEAESEIYDVNELPSKSANLLPEYTNPPWMLEQGWNLDMDEKSKATIEKMLLEEQQYMSGKTSKAKRSLPNKVANSPEKQGSHLISQYRKFWSEQEKQMLLKGMEIYGRSWTKIAELIPSRTSVQIKAFANQYFKAKEKEKQMSSNRPLETAERLGSTLEDTLSTVSTAQPTIPVRDIIIPSKGRIPKSANNNDLKHKTVKSPGKKKVPIKTTKIVKAKTEGWQEFVNGGTNVNNKLVSDGIQTLSVITDTKNHKVTITPHLMENLNGFCAVTNIVPEDDNKDNDSVEDVDIDIENDDDFESNPVLQSRSTSPNSVYEKLVSEANMDQSNVKENFVEKIDKGEKDLIDNDSDKDTETNDGDTLTIKEGPADTCTNDSLNTSSVPKISDICESDVEADKGETTPIKLEQDGTDHLTHTSGCDGKLTEKETVKKIYVNSVTTVEGEVIHFPVPTCEKVFTSNEITDEERMVHPEFFGNRSSKTPERYLRIRNYIIESWKKCRPNYLNKTSVRPGLKNCGDVNCIGRIHAYLECIGAINYGCDQASYNVPKYPSELVRKEKAAKELKGELNVAKLEAMRPRKRKVRDEFGAWIDEKELEGKTIQHTEISEGSVSKSQKSKQIKTEYDPFKLVPCQTFTADNPAPFHVEIHKSALIVMDIHAHISKTEVIGMLGGKYCKDQAKLTVSMATPCNSISTGMQCEMDPVSQTQASEEIRSAGLKVIGWYHSHPVFDPNPSVRDMETQLKFQEWFAKGGSNFVGIIVSPYNPRNPSLGSEFNCLTVQEQCDTESVCNMLVPYKFEFTTCDSDIHEISNLLLTAQDLATSYSTYRNRVDLTSLYRRTSGVTCLDKLIESVQLIFASPDQYLREFLNSIRTVFTKTAEVSDFTNIMKTDIDTCTTAARMDTLTTRGVSLMCDSLEDFSVKGDS